MVGDGGAPQPSSERDRAPRATAAGCGNRRPGIGDAQRCGPEVLLPRGARDVSEYAPGTCRRVWGNRALTIVRPGAILAILHEIQALNVLRGFSGYTSGKASCGAPPNRPPADAEAVKEPVGRDLLGTKGGAGGKLPAGQGTSRLAW